MDALVENDWCFFAGGFVGCHAQFRPYNATEDYMVEIFWTLIAMFYMIGNFLAMRAVVRREACQASHAHVDQDLQLLSGCLLLGRKELADASIDRCAFQLCLALHGLAADSASAAD